MWVSELSGEITELSISSCSLSTQCCGLCGSQFTDGERAVQNIEVTYPDALNPCVDTPVLTSKQPEGISHPLGVCVHVCVCPCPCVCTSLGGGSHPGQGGVALIWQFPRAGAAASSFSLGLFGTRL